jgi:hypothetical protein
VKRSGRRAIARAVILALGSALLYGSWALHANWSSDRPLRAALTQAGLSFASTLTLTIVAEWLFQFGRTPRRGFLVSASGTTTLMASAMVVLHALAGTPRILVTIAPSVAFGSIFYTTYAWGLRLAMAARTAAMR